MGAEAATRPGAFLHRLGLALERPRFQWLLLAVAGLPIVLAYLQSSLFYCLSATTLQPDFQIYLRAAAAIAAGGDPYALAPGSPARTALGGGYQYPPFWAWLLQPLAGHPLLAYRTFVILGQVGVVTSVVALSRSLQIVSWRGRLALAIGIIGYQPLLINFAFGQVMLVLLPVAALWYAATVGNRSWGHVLLGMAVVVKLLQAPALLLALTRWRLRWLLASAAAAGACLLVAVPQLLPAFVTEALPSLSAGSSDIRNLALAGILNRLLHPGLEAGHTAHTDVMVATGLFSLVVVAATARVLWRGRGGGGRALGFDLALVSLISPLIAPLLFATHLLPALVAVLVLLHFGWTQRRKLLLVAGIGWWLTTSLAPWASTSYLIAGGSSQFVLQALAAAALTATAALWLVAVRERLHSLKSDAISLVP